MTTDSEFRKKAEALADLEAQMLNLSGAKIKAVDLDWEYMGGREKIKRQMLIFLGIAAVCGIGLKLSSGGTMSMVFGFGLLCALAGLYMAYARRNDARDAAQGKQELQSKIDALQRRRSSLIRELNQMRRDDPALEGTYWWDTNATPDIRFVREMPGESLPEASWNLNLLQTISITPRKDGLYCEDLQQYPTVIPAEDVQALLDGQSVAVLYENDQIMEQDHAYFQLLQLYATDVEQIEEIVGTTTIVRVDKDAEMAAYREKLDHREIMFNCITRNRLTTNREEAILGHKSLYEYFRDETFRSMAERNQRDRLDSQPDEYESTHYRKSFRGLCDMLFIPCAFVLVSIRPDSDGQTAMILLPRIAMNSVRIVMRTGSSLCGYLERYMGREALQFDEYSIQPSIRMAADFLFTETCAAHMKLKPRDILGPKPNGLTDREWCYLIWRDRRKKDP